MAISAALGCIVLGLFSGEGVVAAFVNGLFFALFGFGLLGWPVFMLGSLAALLIWIPIKRLGTKTGYSEAVSLALAASATAVLGGVVPWGLLAVFQPYSVASALAVCAFLSVVVAPTVVLVLRQFSASERVE